jgi:hypothetical protein
MTSSHPQLGSVIDWLDGKFKEGSAADLKARRVLAQVLRSGRLDRGLRFMLADLFDPDTRLYRDGSYSSGRPAIAQDQWIIGGLRHSAFRHFARPREPARAGTRLIRRSRENQRDTATCRAAARRRLERVAQLIGAHPCGK